MTHYRVDPQRAWDYENGFYLAAGVDRLAKLLGHYEIYRKILDVSGDVLELGVYKGSSLMRWLAFRRLLEGSDRRRIVGFDAFGAFPDDLALDSDRRFVRDFEAAGGAGIARDDLERLIAAKDSGPVELVEGDLLETLPAWIEERPDLRLALLHVDVDVYEPTRLALDLLWDRLVPGGVLLLDDYRVVEGETRAVDEFFAERGVTPRLEPLPHYPVPSYTIKD